MDTAGRREERRNCQDTMGYMGTRENKTKQERQRYLNLCLSITDCFPKICLKNVMPLITKCLQIQLISTASILNLLQIYFMDREKIWKQVMTFFGKLEERYNVLQLKWLGHFSLAISTPAGMRIWWEKCIIHVNGICWYSLFYPAGLENIIRSHHLAQRLPHNG